MQRFQPLEQTLDEELADAGDEIKRAEKERIREMIDALPLDRYEIADGGADWADAEKQARSAQANGRTGKSTTVSVKSQQKHGHGKRKAGEAMEAAEREAEKFREKKSKKSKKEKKDR